MRRRVISLGSVLLAVVALAVVLVNATLVDRRPPGIDRVSLSAAANDDGTLAQTITAIDIEFSEPVRPGTVERRFRIVPYVPGAISWDGSTAIFTPSQKLPQDTEFTVFVDPGYEDLAGNAATAGVDAWTFRTVGPPAVVAIDPPDGAAGLGVAPTVTITFDRLMDTASVEAAVKVEPQAAFRSAWSGQSLALTFEPPLAFGTTYTVTVAASAADTDGSRLRAPMTTRFTTVAAGLGVRTTVPADGVAGVGIRTPIAVVFDGPIAPDSVRDALRITPAVAGDIEVIALPSDTGPRPSAGGPSEAPATMLVFHPSQPLAPHTTYTVSLDPVVARLDAPAQVAAGRTWSFTTGQPAVTGQNQVAFLSARGGVRNVWLMNPDGSNPRQLTTELVPVAAFDVTADGSRVAWSAGGNVRTMRVDGTEERTLTSAERYEYAPRFTPDGRSLLVARRDAAGTDEGYWLVPLDPTAGPERQLLPSGAPSLGSSAVAGDGITDGEGTPDWAARAAFDPSGRWALVTTGAGGVRLIDLQPEDPSLAVVDTGLVSAAPPVWSVATGAFVVVGSRGTDAEPATYGLATDGTANRLSGGLGSVAASTDGLLAYLVRDLSGTTHVGIVRAGSPAPARPLTSAPSLADRTPTFGPDGRSILFGRVHAADPTASAGIWVVDTATGALSPLAPDGAYPRWLP